MRNVSEKKNCKGNQNTHFVLNSFFFFENCAVYEIMWKKKQNSREGHRSQYNTAQRCACWITKAADTHSEYVILIALPRQRWLRERALMYIACFVIFRSWKSAGYSFVSCRWSIHRSL